MRQPCWIAQLSDLLLNLEITNEGTLAGLKAKAREKVSSPVRRRHQETGPEKEAKIHSAPQTFTHSTTQPTSHRNISHYFLKKYIYLFFQNQGRIIIYYIKETQISHHPLRYSLGSAKKKPYISAKASQRKQLQKGPRS